MSNQQPEARATKPLDHEIGVKIRTRRHQLGLTQQNLAEALHISFQQVQKYERGRNRISASTLVEIAKALDCRSSDFLGEVDGPVSIDWSQFANSDTQQVVLAFNAIQSQCLRQVALGLLREMAGQEPLHE